MTAAMMAAPSLPTPCKSHRPEIYERQARKRGNGNNQIEQPLHFLHLLLLVLVVIAQF